MKAARIPPVIDQGKHQESCMSYIYHHWREYKSIIKDGVEPLVTDNAERFACGFPLPEFQRSNVWTRDQEVAFIENAWRGIPLGTFTHHALDWEDGGRAKPFSGWLIDGQQRLTTIQLYWSDAFPAFGLYWSELTKAEVRRFMNIKFTHYEPELWDENEIRKLYNVMAFGGTQHKESERA